MAALTLDAGALIGYERGTLASRDAILFALERGVVPVVPAVALAEVWRGGPRSARLAMLLRDCEVEILDEDLAREAGILMARVSGSGTIDACVAAGVRRRGGAVATSDPGDLAPLLPDRHPLIAV